MRTLGLGAVYCGFATAAAMHDKRFQSTLKIGPDKGIDGFIAMGYPKIKLKKWIEREAKTTWI